MEIQSDVNGEMAIVKEKRQQLESRVDALHKLQLDFIASLQTLVPDIVSSLDLSLKVVSAFNGRPFTPLPTLSPNPDRKRPKLPPPENHTNATETRSLRRSAERRAANSKNQQLKPPPEISICRSDGEKVHD